MAYSVSKSGMLNLTEYLSVYWANKNIRVNTLTLGGVYNNQDDEFFKKLYDQGANEKNGKS